MSTEKPKRYPDYITDTGVLYYFEERLRFAGDRTDIITEDPIDGVLVKKVKNSNKGSCGCRRCSEDKVCENYVFSDHVQEAYRNWVVSTFEKAFGIVDV